MKTPIVSIIVPVYRDWRQLERCMLALESQTYPSDAYEVLVVNNSGEADKIIPLKKNFQLLSEPRRGSYAARNAGLAQANGEILGFTDADCVPLGNWIEEAVSFLQLRPQYSALGGRIQVLPAGDPPNVYEQYDMLTAFPQKYYVETRKFAATANMFAYRNVFDGAGVFNESLVSGGDTEWGQRISKMGYSLAYADNVIVRHPARATLKAHVDKRRRIARGKHVLEGEKGTLKLVRVLGFAYQLRPPLRFALRTLTNTKLALSRKMKLIVLAYYLKLIYEFERLKLLFSARAR